MASLKGKSRQAANPLTALPLQGRNALCSHNPGYLKTGTLGCPALSFQDKGPCGAQRLPTGRFFHTF